MLPVTRSVELEFNGNYGIRKFQSTAATTSEVTKEQRGGCVAMTVPSAPAVLPYIPMSGMSGTITQNPFQPSIK
jgi:hypothetical protein